MSASGLHARPASLFAQAAAGCGAEVLISRVGGEGVDAASILSVMSLGLQHGEEAVLQADESGEAALDELAAMLSRDLDEA